jgi:hypothetical protein
MGTRNLTHQVNVSTDQMRNSTFAAMRVDENRAKQPATAVPWKSPAPGVVRQSIQHLNTSSLQPRGRPAGIPTPQQPFHRSQVCGYATVLQLQGRHTSHPHQHTRNPEESERDV